MTIVILAILLAAPHPAPPSSPEPNRAAGAAHRTTPPRKGPGAAQVQGSRPRAIPRPGLLPFLGATLPGLVYPAGHLVMGDTRGHLRIIATKGTGLVLMLLGALPILLTNASTKVIHLPIYMLTTGFALFSSATAADIYGSLFSGRPPGRAPEDPARSEVEAGYRFIHDPLMDNAHSLVVAGRYYHHRLLAEVDASLTPPSRNLRVSLFGGYRLLRTINRDSWLDCKAGLTWRRYATEGFTTLTTELFAVGRLDLGRVLPTLRGAFSELGAGAALRFIGYDALGGGVGEDSEVIPLFRFAFGVYLGDRGSEVKLFYDHRHDDELGGLALASGFDGALGHFGLEGTWWVSTHVGLRALVAAGSAHLARFTVVVRE